MKIKSLTLIILLFLLTFGCQTVKQKSDEIVKKENEKFGKYLGEQSIKLKMEIGEPNEDFISDIGNEILIYKCNRSNYWLLNKRVHLENFMKFFLILVGSFPHKQG